jgi:hypothetical protein
MIRPERIWKCDRKNAHQMTVLRNLALSIDMGEIVF